MVVQSPDQLAPRLEIYRRSMVHLESASSYRVLSADAYTKHGLNASGIVVDEVHAQKNRELIDVLHDLGRLAPAAGRGLYHDRGL